MAFPNERDGYVAPFAEWISHPFEIWTGNISGLKQQCKFC